MNIQFIHMSSPADPLAGEEVSIQGADILVLATIMKVGVLGTG